MAQIQALDNVIDFDVRPTAAVVAVDPILAARWLTANVKNRPIKKREVAKYARDMAAGRWQITGEAIKFATDGTLLDGQNRLHAVIKSEATVMLFVVRGLATNAQSVMDTGAKRSAADALNLQGRTNASNLAAAARLALGIKAVGYEKASRHSVSTAEIEEFLDYNPEMARAVQLSMEFHRKIDCLPAVVSYAAWRLTAIDQGDALRFLVAGGNKVGLYEGDPTIAMTYRFAEARRSGIRYPHDVHLSVIFRAWNDRRVGKSVSIYRVNSKDNQRIPVPEPK